MIIPKQFLKTIQRSGLGKNLFARDALREDGNGEPGLRAQPAGVPQREDPGGRRQLRLRLEPRARALGAARLRHPLRDRDLASPTSSTTTASRTASCRSCCSPEDFDKLIDDAERGANATLTVDLEKQQISGPDGGSLAFDVEPFRRHCLLNGLDDIGLTLEKAQAIDAYERRLAERPWA